MKPTITSATRPLTVYFYHTQDIQYILGMYAKRQFPSHFLYGALHLEENGFNVIWHKSKFVGKPRWIFMLYNLWQILRNYRRFDVLYATHYRGGELPIFLRSIGLFRKPIVIWHHQPVITPKNKIRDLAGRLFYCGIDRMIFFSKKLFDDSLRTGKVPAYKMFVGHWGPDLDFYDRLLTNSGERSSYVSTGKERRDIPTLIEAYSNVGAQLEMYLNKTNGELNYEEAINHMAAQGKIKENVHIHFFSGLNPARLAQEVCKAKCVVVCCRETKYTVGLTTVVEALALGLPIICSRNPQMPFRFERDGIGLSVPYYDTDGWTKAIKYMEEHPAEALQMGRKARELAETTCNDRKCAAEVAEIIKHTLL